MTQRFPNFFDTKLIQPKKIFPQSFFYQNFLSIKLLFPNFFDTKLIKPKKNFPQSFFYQNFLLTNKFLMTIIFVDKINFWSPSACTHIHTLIRHTHIYTQRGWGPKFDHVIYKHPLIKTNYTHKPIWLIFTRSSPLCLQ